MPHWETELDNQYKQLKEVVKKNVNRFKNMHTLKVNAQFIFPLIESDFIDPEIETAREALENLFKNDNK